MELVSPVLILAGTMGPEQGAILQVQLWLFSERTEAARAGAQFISPSLPHFPSPPTLLSSATWLTHKVLLDTNSEVHFRSTSFPKTGIMIHYANELIR